LSIETVNEWLLVRVKVPSAPGTVTESTGLFRKIDSLGDPSVRSKRLVTPAGAAKRKTRDREVIYKRISSKNKAKILIFD